MTILAFLLPFISNHQGIFNTKMKEVLARSMRSLCTRRTTSTTRATSSGKSSRMPTRTYSKPAKCISLDDKLAIFFGTQVRYTGINWLQHLPVLRLNSTQAAGSGNLEPWAGSKQPLNLSLILREDQPWPHHSQPQRRDRWSRQTVPGVSFKNCECFKLIQCLRKGP